MSGQVDDLLQLLDLEPLEVNIYRGQNRDIGTGRVFGGQVFAQALVAARRTVDGPREAHSVDTHRAAAGGTRERVDLEDLLQERRPAAGGLGRREAWRGDDHGRRRERDRLSLTSHPARTVGIPAVVPRGHVALVGDVHQDPG